ncbi:hypothetical protein POJ06DRAFT_71423 [Lipomyces tetrasporus]|uniref:TNase-like domain-containing protein n=1 Tax=Lipomyces tetrasporus TaxID=54092 RepID=A0AAD7QV23_9ASCO|nr:uncharacterized protein POJ06DRAFT_71423 [Lipomyces tetrasporus]KAJ8101808.1 hypothetical protein POJ06DRAFT_71423 [Lipomyces tetrasporus]
MAPLFAAKVKSALSGDTLQLTTVRPPQPGQVPAERTFSLAYVSAPRLKRDEGDEPFAFQSREQLRLQLVGQVVQCEVFYTVPTTNREYGIVYLPNKVSVNEQLISAGSVRVRQPTAKESTEPNELLEKYRSLEAAAKENALGLWAPKVDTYKSFYDVPAEFAGKYRSQQIDAIVERIINGDRALVRFMLPGQHVQVPLLIAGVRAPRSPSTTDAAAEPGEPLGDVAKFYVEARLLQRNVKVEVLGTSNQGVLIGIVLHPAGNIAERLLESGLAVVSDWQSNFLGAANMSKLRAAEQTAKAKGINLWHGVAVQAVKGGAESEKSFTATVGRVISADTLSLRMKNGDEKVVQLASVRGPRQADSKQASYVNAAREFVRKKTIGKHVKVVILHTRPKSEQFEERDMATVELARAAGQSTGSSDLAAILVENGYATVIRHRKDQVEDRSPIWDELLEKEEAAIKAKKGFHSGVALPAERIVNASESHARASAFLPSLMRQKRVPAIVEFVNSGSRLRLLLPRDNARIRFILAGVATPRVAMTGPGAGTGVVSEKSEPFGEEAQEFTSRRLLQRDVEVDVTHADRSGGFFGLLHVPGTKDTFAKTLLDEGLARLDEYSAQEAAVLSQFRDAEEAAQAAKKGVWKDDKGKAKPVEMPVTVAAEGAARKKEYLNVVVTNVESDGSFVYIVLNDSIGKLATLTSTVTAQPPIALTNRPRINDLVVYPIPGTKSLGRFRVTHYDNSRKQASLTSIDFGLTVTSAPLTKLRTLPSEFSPTLSGIPALAKTGKLSLVKWPEFQDDYLDDAVNYFYDIVVSTPETLLGSGSAPQKLVAIVDGSADGAALTTLFEASDIDKSINTKLAEEGWVYIPSDKALRRSVERSYVGSKEVADLRKVVEDAKRERKGIWEYGDVTPDED